MECEEKYMKRQFLMEISEDRLKDGDKLLCQCFTHTRVFKFLKEEVYMIYEGGMQNEYFMQCPYWILHQYKCSIMRRLSHFTGYIVCTEISLYSNFKCYFTLSLLPNIFIEPPPSTTSFCIMNDIVLFLILQKLAVLLMCNSSHDYVLPC